MKYGEYSRVRDLLADPSAVAIIEKHLPGASSHPQLSQALDMSLKEVSWYPESGLTPELLKRIVEDLSTLTA